MKNFYNISKGQLITIWIFGIVGTLVAINEADYGSALSLIFAVGIPFIVIFYTLGWRNNQ